MCCCCCNRRFWNCNNIRETTKPSGNSGTTQSVWPGPRVPCVFGPGAWPCFGVLIVFKYGFWPSFRVHIAFKLGFWLFHRKSQYFADLVLWNKCVESCTVNLSVNALTPGSKNNFCSLLESDRSHFWLVLRVLRVFGSGAWPCLKVLCIFWHGFWSIFCVFNALKLEICLSHRKCLFHSDTILCDKDAMYCLEEMFYVSYSLILHDVLGHLTLVCDSDSKKHGNTAFLIYGNTRYNKCKQWVSCSTRGRFCMSNQILVFEYFMFDHKIKFTWILYKYEMKKDGCKTNLRDLLAALTFNMDFCLKEWG